MVYHGMMRVKQKLDSHQVGDPVEAVHGELRGLKLGADSLSGFIAAAIEKSDLIPG